MATVTHAAVAIPSFTGLKSAGDTKLASTSVKLSSFSPIPRMSIKSSLKNVGVAIAATAASALLANNALANKILLGSSDGGLAFVPNDFSIGAGDKIVFKNNAGFPHNVVFDEDEIPGGVDATKISMSEEDLLNAPGDTYTVTLTEKGTYSFYCSPHQGAGMSGKVNQFVMPSVFRFPMGSASLFLAAVDTAGYSLASYYTSLGLFVISVPGLWSLIKRSVKSKIVKKTFVGEEKKAPSQLAGEILSFFTRNNFVVTDRGETITFEGMMVPSRGQAALLTFCTCISLASVALVLTITVPDFGNNWFGITVLSPLAGAYYWKLASRKEEIKVKMIVIDDGAEPEVVVQGDDQQIEQMRKELKLSEKGMVYVKGLFER